MQELEISPLKKMLFGLIKCSKKDLVARFKKAQADITPLQYWILMVLTSNSITLNELARQFDMKPPSLLSSIDALEKSGYLVREHNKKDRRKIQLIITTSGSKLIKNLSFNEDEDALNKSFNKLSGAKQQQLLSLLKELTTTISQFV